ncbi:Phoxy PX domain protein [Pyrenophora tritici-repentis]|uniref:PX domain containing protein n=1 Tax=Pyrenophora tritici-repentis TaxID=45151 RepID=A0A2W1GVR3_9PLEO|nr:Phox proteiny domain protein [Pyrenophora tritici-repentis]KAF7443166.1 Phox proteiny domain protein [Pyrenophora tritici-repentis]KAF7568361.1 Phox proteiny (PX) domain protein [Pyrenophora tritici-repentis]KAG9377157.1 Phox proteiny domain protein [Pyrenophora tritici-repentis]KAI0581794.1 Phox proteiny (PX) domain protein [Pyrenophora tritici-repentis]
MWDDEDNNPYGSFARHDSTDIPGIASPAALPYRPATPPSEAASSPAESPEYVSQRDMSDVDYNEDRGDSKAPKKGGYDARVEQWLYEHPDQLVLITSAGKDGVNYIQYTINCGGLEVKRRYSEFASLRTELVRLHPTLIVPPIPEKHTMADYAAKPTKAKEDAGIIELRKRMLAVFLNRCRKMKDILEDGVFWRFLDPYTSWADVLNSPPISNIPKQILKAPPLDTANPSQAHSYLPVPSSSAKLKSGGATSSSGTPVSPANNAAMPSAAAHTTPGPAIFGRFPPETRDMSEEELDPYFVSFENSSKDLEHLLQGPMEKVNRRLLMHLGNWGEDMADLGARFNAFSLSEQTQTLAAAIEKTGQAVDSTYIATTELSSSLSASFSEPMRESAQFAGVVRSVLRYRVLKRIQEDMTKDELEKKRNLLESLERSEAESKRLEQHLSGVSQMPPPRNRSASNSSQRSSTESDGRQDEDRASIDSDFPPTHGETPSSAQGAPSNHSPPSTLHKKTASGNFVTNKLFGSITHAFRGMADVDPEKTRRDQIGKTRDSMVQLEQALTVAEKDTKDASSGVLKDLRRFQNEKEDDLRRYMMEFAQCHIDWAKRNKAAWEEAKTEVENIVAQPTEEYPGRPEDFDARD